MVRGRLAQTVNEKGISPIEATRLLKTRQTQSYRLPQHYL